MRNGKRFFPVLLGVILLACFSNVSWAETAENVETGVKSAGKASIQNITDWYEAVGAVRPRTEIRVEAQITARVLKVMAGAGDKVRKGQVLISLDNRQLLSRLDQAKQGLKGARAGKKQARQSVAAAEAAFKQAKANYERTQKYFKSQAATSQQLERAEADFLQAKAGLSRAKEALSGGDAKIRHAEEVIKEAEIALGYTRLKAPEDGDVLKRLVDPGDLAAPGKPLIMLQTAGSLRLEAHVREGL
ncbi:MAG: biotin/lipoyl-binding protein, partial [Desulfobacterales bacterium]|nr:biotin/lipoyl-binding protein [Desulfobacterales bacterium]